MVLRQVAEGGYEHGRIQGKLHRPQALARRLVGVKQQERRLPRPGRVREQAPRTHEQVVSQC